MSEPPGSGSRLIAARTGHGGHSFQSIFQSVDRLLPPNL